MSVNIKNAVGVNDPDIKLMDMGTSYDHYNTKEYFHPISNRNNTNAKTLILTLAFGLPIIIWITTTLNPLWNYAALLNMTAAISMIVGLVIERRLFFIQGNNIQNLYYANFKNAGARNPIVSKARRGTPLAP